MRSYALVVAAVATTGRTPRSRFADLLIAATSVAGVMAARRQEFVPAGESDAMDKSASHGAQSPSRLVPSCSRADKAVAQSWI